MTQPETAAVVGAGVIGASWAALFAAAGAQVHVYDSAEDVYAFVRSHVNDTWPVLTQLSLTSAEAPHADQLVFHNTPADAVREAEFVQESVPEQLPLKRELFTAIENALPENAVVASSASGLTLTEMQGGWSQPDRFVLGHPFNPPHLIPLVEVMGNDRTDPQAVEQAEAFYKAVGKVTIRVNKEFPGHVSNRMQAALWREAIHLVLEGVVSLEDADKAIWAGPGLRWAAMGPNMLFNLAAGEGGLGEYCSRYEASFNRWWSEMGTPTLNADTAAVLVKGVEDAARGQSREEITAERDRLIVAMLSATRGLRSE